MRAEQRQIGIGNDQTVSAVIAYPDQPAPGPRTALILAHGAGTDMHNPFLSAMHEGLATHGYMVVKFNFPYKERGGRAPDTAPVLEACFRRVVEFVRNDTALNAERLVIGGKSLGGRMASHLAAKGEAVAGLLFLGYPLHPPGQRDKLRIAHLDKIQAPMLFFAGTRDALCTLDLLQRTIKQLSAPVTLHIIEGGDHSFNVLKSLKRTPRAVWDEIIAASVGWLTQL